MQLNQFTLKQIISKVALSIAILYAVLISISLLITASLYLGLNHYKPQFQNLISKKTGYNITIGHIEVGLNDVLAPKIIFDNTKITNPKDPKQIFQIKHLELVPSFSSIWRLSPIFSKIIIDGTTLNVKHLDDGSIFLNGIKINEKSTSKKPSLDIEKLLLDQKQIALSHININYIENDIPTFSIYNLNIIFKNNYIHSLYVSIGSSLDKEDNAINGTLTWSGGKLSRLDTLKNARLVVGTKESVAIDSMLQNGRLQYLNANFDIQNLNYFMTHNQNMINFPKLGGSIKVKLINNDHYTLEANNLTVSTESGNVLDNKKITGNYVINKHGSLSILNTDLSGFNNLVSIFPIANKLIISGTIELVKLSWLGNIFHPDNFKISANFANLGIKSKDEKIPSFNNLSGSLLVTKESGEVNLNLKNSIFNYPKLFLVPYKFNSLSTKLSWQINSNKSFVVNLDPTNIDEVDFKGNAVGKYTYTSGGSGFLDLRAHIDKMLVTKVGNYLPIVIGMPVHKWLNAGLIGGYAKNANLILSGELSHFPFTDGSGKFYIDADVDHAKLNYANPWPPLENIVGKFQIRNQKIIIIANSAKISENNINNATVIIPDMTSKKRVYLTADGVASGSTSNFMTYLRQTPVNDIIGKIPEKITTSGNGVVKIHLMVPFDDPLHTEVNGSYNFNNNSLEFNDLPIPLLSNTNGSLFFSEHGLRIDRIDTKTLNSDANLSVVTDKSGTMHFNVYSPNLDYYELSDYYISFISSIFKGKSPTNISFDIGKRGIDKISATSTLLGVTILAPQPLGKESSTSNGMEFTLAPDHGRFSINFNYAKMLFGNVLFNEHGKLDHTYISFGNPNLPTATKNDPKVLISVDTNNFDGVQWLETVLKTIKPASESNSKQNHFSNNISKSHETSNNIFPIEVLVNTGNLFIYNSNYQQTNSDILVNKDKILFNLNNTFSNGFGSFEFATKTLNIALNKFNLLQSPYKKPQQQNPKNTMSKFADLNQIQTSQAKESGIAIDTKHLKPMIESISNEAMNFPNIILSINNFYFENMRAGLAKVNLKPKGNDLLIESGQFIGKSTEIYFHGANYCITCAPNKQFVEVVAHTKIHDLGSTIEHFGFGTVVESGSGTVDTTLQWNGKLQDFKLEHAIAAIKVDLKDGKFLKVSTGGIFGEILGIVNLQTLTNLIKLDFSQSFSNGFYFNTLKSSAFLLNNVLTIKSLYMSGPVATVQSFGTINITSETLDVYMNVIPKLGAGFAIGAGAATLSPVAGPIVGVAVYAGEWALGEPLNKLFSFGFHITGSLKKPTITSTKISDQAINNLNSAIGIGTNVINTPK